MIQFCVSKSNNLDCKRDQIVQVRLDTETIF